MKDLPSFGEFFKESYVEKEREASLQAIRENIKKSGFEILKGRFLKYRDLGEHFEISDFTYSIDKKEGVRSFKITCKVGTKTVVYEFDAKKGNQTVKHSLDSEVDIYCPCSRAIIHLLVHMVDDKSGYVSGINSAAYALIEQLEKQKSKGE